MGLFDSLSVTEKAAAGITTGLAATTIAATSYAVGKYVADKKHTAVQEKIQKFARVKSYLIHCLNVRGFHDDAALEVYLGKTCPTELDRDQTTGEPRGDRALLYENPISPGSFRSEIFPTGEIARRLEKAYTYLLQWGHERSSGENCDLKASTIVFYMKLLKQISQVSKTVFYTPRGLDFLEAVIEAIHLTSIDPDVVHSRTTDGDTARAFSFVVSEMRDALGVAAIEMGRISAQEYLKELRDVSSALMVDISRHFISVVSAQDRGVATVADHSTLSPIGWGPVAGTLLQGIVYQIFGLQSKRLSVIHESKAEREIRSEVSAELRDFFIALLKDGSHSFDTRPTAIFLQNLKEIKFEGDTAVFVTSTKNGPKPLRVSSGISPNLLAPTKFADFTNYLEKLAISIETTALLVEFQDALTAFAAAKGNEKLYGEGMQALFNLGNATEIVYKRLLACSKDLDGLSKAALGEARVREYLEGQTLSARMRRLWYGTGDADRGIGNPVAASYDISAIHARSEMGMGLLASLKKAAIAFAENTMVTPTPTLLELNRLALNLGGALALEDMEPPKKLEAVQGALQQLERVKEMRIHEITDAKNSHSPSSSPTTESTSSYSATDTSSSAPFVESTVSTAVSMFDLKQEFNAACVALRDRLGSFSAVGGGKLVDKRKKASDALALFLADLLKLKGTSKERINLASEMSKDEGRNGVLAYKLIFNASDGTLRLPEELLNDGLIRRFKLGIVCSRKARDSREALQQIRTHTVGEHPEAHSLPDEFVFAFAISAGLLHLARKDDESTYFSWSPVRLKGLYTGLDNASPVVRKRLGSLGEEFQEALGLLRIVFEATPPTPAKKETKEENKIITSSAEIQLQPSEESKAELKTSIFPEIFATDASLSLPLEGSPTDDKLDRKVPFEHTKSLLAQSTSQLKEKAARGDMAAQFLLGHRYQFGQGERINQEAAIPWYEMASLQGHPVATFLLSLCYERDEDDKDDKDDGDMIEDRSKAVPLLSGEAIQKLHMAAESEDFFAQDCLGLCYELGKVLSQNPAQAITWYRRAVVHGYSIAQFHLGCCYYNGIGVLENQIQAVEWWQKAADQGLALAQRQLGSCCEMSNIVANSKKEAEKWYSQAANQGDPAAKKDLQRIRVNLFAKVTQEVAMNVVAAGALIIGGSNFAATFAPKAFAMPKRVKRQAGTAASSSSTTPAKSATTTTSAANSLSGTADLITAARGPQLIASSHAISTSIAATATATTTTAIPATTTTNISSAQKI